VNYGRKPIKERLDRNHHKVDETGCWEWLGAKYSNGYGAIRKDYSSLSRTGAHRAAYEAHHGPIPVGLRVCHRCDNRLCINPDHLFLGTASDNTKDMVRKGRHGNMKLTQDSVKEIREAFKHGTSSKDIQSKYQISKSLASKILTNKLWKDI
jgi:hypothetical protein